MSWLTLAIISMVAKSAQNFAEKSSQKQMGSFLTLFLLIVLSTIFILPFVLFRDPLPAVNFTFWLAITASVATYVLAKPMRLFAIGVGDISEIVPLVSFSSLFSVIFGWIF